jgi:hypothetical protein
MSTNVIVDLGVNTNASGTIQVFGQNLATITDKVVASVGISRTLLFADSNNGIIEFQGVDDAIVGRPDSIFTGVSAGTEGRKAALASAIQLSLTTGNLNASTASPFTDVRYGVIDSYKNYSSFGSLALGSYAHYLFGHADATAAISNDTAFITKMDGVVELSGHAMLGKKLAEAIFTLDNAACTSIAKQVIGQDASRAFGIDNDNQGVDGWQQLAFKQGDKIYVSITLDRPEVALLDTEQLAAPLNTLFPANGIKYMVEITLSP